MKIELDVPDELLDFLVKNDVSEPKDRTEAAKRLREILQSMFSNAKEFFMLFKATKDPTVIIDALDKMDEDAHKAGEEDPK